MRPCFVAFMETFRMSRSIFRCGILLLVLVLSVPIGARAEGELAGVSRLFREFVAGLQPADLAAGSCVRNSTRFYEKLLDAHLDTSKARLVLVVREPDQGMPQPMRPNPAMVRGEKPNFWIWHAFVAYDGIVFDANYLRDGDSIKGYFEKMWSSDRCWKYFWVFSVQYKDLPAIAGSDYPGGPPRMLRFKPISPAEFAEKPLHLTERR